ncbi:MAG: Wzz/FepE/Etk N-terminal domain-containing protein [Chloroflexota bacterium]
MELRAFWEVIKRWRWVVIVVTLASILGSGLWAAVSPPGYKAQTTLSFSAPPPASSVSLPGFDEQNRLMYSEQVVDDFTKIVDRRAFADGVAKRLPFKMDPKQVQGVWTVKKLAHHLLNIQAAAPTQARAVALARAAEQEILLNGQAYFKTLNTPDLQVSVIDPAVSEGISGRILDMLLIVGRVVVGLVVGIGLAFLFNYLDDRINTGEEAEALGFRILGSIPQAAHPARDSRAGGGNGTGPSGPVASSSGRGVG